MDNRDNRQHQRICRQLLDLWIPLNGLNQVIRSLSRFYNRIPHPTPISGKLFYLVTVELSDGEVGEVGFWKLLDFTVPRYARCDDVAVFLV